MNDTGNASSTPFYMQPTNSIFIFIVMVYVYVYDFAVDYVNVAVL